jgi:2-isopropylmalate synthase
MIRDTVGYLKKQGREVLYDAEHFFDTFRENRDYALATIKAASDAGADLVVLCETNGGSLPSHITEATRSAIAHLGKPVGVHTHNDCGLGVANALAGVEAGACQVQGTINGYGERVGNCNLITIIANLQLKYGIEVVSNLTKLRELSYFVAELANVAPDIRAPFVGEAAFTHKGGLHVGRRAKAFQQLRAHRSRARWQFPRDRRFRHERSSQYPGPRRGARLSARKGDPRR